MSHVMIVEDEPITAADLEQKLGDLGYEISWFDTGEEAVAQARDLSPDLVLMDIRLRGDWSGIDAARQMRAERDLPVIFITAFADPDTIDQACQTQPYGYLLKPFTERDVAAAVQVAFTRVAAERSQLERERWIATALQSSGEALIAVDDHASIRFVNTQAETLLRMRAQDLCGRDARDVLRFATDELGGSAQPLDLALRDDCVTSSTARALLLQERKASLLVTYSAAPVHTHAGDRAGAILVFREVEAGPMATSPGAHSLTALDKLSRRLSHEINNPLTYNLGALHLALRELDQLRAMSSLASAQSDASGPQHEGQLLRIADFLRDAEEGATRIAGVVRELNLFSLSEREVAPHPPLELLALAVGLSKIDATDHVHIVREIEAAPLIKGDKWQLAGVIAYALRSALDALEQRSTGTITLTLAVGKDERGWAELRVTAMASPGTEPAAAARAQPTHEIMPPTTVSRNLAEQVLESHGGELVISDLPQGRTLQLRLPPMSIATEMATHGAEGSRRRSVLVVEDEPMSRCALEITLRPEHDVTAVASGRSALDLLAQGDAFDVVLCDLPLPDMNGHTFYERLHALRPDVAERMIIIACHPTGPHDSSFLQRMVGRRLDKPFNTDQLLSIVSARAAVQNAAGGAP